MSESKLYAAISAVMKDISGITKDGRVTGTNGYDYITADNVLSAVGRSMAHSGLVIIPTITSQQTNNVEYQVYDYKTKAMVTKSRYESIVNYDMLIACADSDSKLNMKWLGYGINYQSPDKALYAAMTSGHKYFYLKLFAVAVDNTDSEHNQPETTKSVKQTKPQPKQKQDTKPSKPPVISKITKEIEQRLSNTEDKHHGGGSRDISPEEMKTFDALQYLKTSQKTTYTTIQEALVMTGSFKNEQFAMDMIQSFDYPPRDNREYKPMGTDAVTKEGALMVFNWCLENNGKSDA